MNPFPLLLNPLSMVISTIRFLAFGMAPGGAEGHGRVRGVSPLWFQRGFPGMTMVYDNGRLLGCNQICITYIYIYVCMYVYTHIYIYVCIIYVCIYIYMYIYMFLTHFLSLSLCMKISMYKVGTGIYIAEIP